jgi:endonuclease/exonuclease/phosphatase family metal-dependent hydrolase
LTIYQYLCIILKLMIELMAWNLHEGLALAERSPQIVEAIKQQEADVVMLSDVYWLDNPLHGADGAVAETALDSLGEEGYQAFRAEYADDHEWQRHYMILLSRIAVQNSTTLRLGHRNGIGVMLQDPASKRALHTVGAHFDDRTEALRQGQVAALLEHIDVAEPTVLIGDLNALHGEDSLSKLICNPLLQLLARGAMNARYFRQGNEEKRAIVPRLREMASGTTFDVLEAAGLRDIDLLHRPTMPSGRPLFHLDRCFVSRDVRLLRDFSVVPRTNLSDHRAITVTVGM